MESTNQPMGPPPDNNLVWAILCTVLCCLPLGIVSIIKSTKKREEIKLTNNNFAKSITSFLSRLHWRSHFIQKLEDQPSIEHTSFIPIYDQIRERDEKKFK